MTPRLTRAFFAALLLPIAATALAPPAYAQDLAPYPKPARRIKLDGVCADSIARFCPALADRPGQTLSQVTCLKPYRTSLPLSCRRAVTASLK